MAFDEFTKSRAANLAPVESVHDFKKLIFIWKGVNVLLTERLKK